MSVQYHSQIGRLQMEIAALDREAAAVSKKEADLIGKINRAQDAAHRATSISSMNSRLRELEQASKNLSDVKKKQSDISAKKAQKSKTLLDCQGRQARVDDAARKKVETDQRRFIRELAAQQRRMFLDVRKQHLSIPTETSSSEMGKPYDFFISHASEDKDEVVRDLAECLRSKGAKVWYDEFTLKVGSRLRREIDRGLVNSRFGIVVVSHNFFAKDWPQRELDGLFALDTEKESRILPIWHKVSKDEVIRYSPTLADIRALNTAIQPIEDISEELLSIIR